MITLILMSIIAAATALATPAPAPWCGLSVIGLLVMGWLHIRSLRQPGAQPVDRTPKPGQRFCLAQTDSMGVSIRTTEWGEVLRVETGLCERGEIYDGDASADVREILRKRGQDTWLRVRYEDGNERWEPLWESKLTDGYWERIV